VWGPPGIGKSDKVRDAARKLADQFGLQYSEKPEHFRGTDQHFVLIDLRASYLEAVDTRGIPSLRGDATVWNVPEFFPHKGRGIIFLDDFPFGLPVVRKAFFQLILQRRILSYVLPPGWAVFAAGNRPEDVPDATPLSKPTANRFSHCVLKVPSALEWIQNFALPHRVSPLIIGFLQWRQGLLFDMRYAERSDAFPTPRSWFFASQWIGEETDPEKIEVLAATSVGVGAAHELRKFVEFRQYLPDPLELLRNPRTTELPPSYRFDLRCALITTVAEAVHAKPQFFDNAVIIAERLEPELGLLLLQMIKSRDLRQWLKWSAKSRVLRNLLMVKGWKEYL